MYAVHGTVGYRQGSVNAYAGIQPYVIAGRIDLRVPAFTDSLGTMHYRDSSINVRDERAVVYAGMNWQNHLTKHTSLSVSATANVLGDHQIRTNVSKSF